MKHTFAVIVTWLLATREQHRPLQQPAAHKKMRGLSPRLQNRKRLPNNALRRQGTLFRGNYSEFPNSSNRGKSTGC
jgi:hypothetical protein